MVKSRKYLLIKHARCLRKNRRSFECKSKENVCKTCGGPHHIFICNVLAKNQPDSEDPKPKPDQGREGVPLQEKPHLVIM